MFKKPQEYQKLKKKKVEKYLEKSKNQITRITIKTKLKQRSQIERKNK